MKKLSWQMTLAQAEEQIRSLPGAIESLRDAVYIISPRGRILYANPTFHRLSGYSVRAVQNKSIFELIYPEDRKRVQDYFTRLVQGRPSPQQYQCRLIRRDGGVRWAEIRVALIHYQGQKTVIGNFVDVTARRQKEQALQESAALSRGIIDSWGDPIHVVDPELRIVLANRALGKWSRELGLPTDMVGRRLMEVFPFLPKKVLKEYQIIFRSGQTLLTEETTLIGGREFATETRKIPVFERDRVRRVVTIIRDITQRKLSEARLSETSKLEAVGTLALSIAHEFNNILMGISGYAQLALAAPADREMTEKAMGIILRQAQRGKTLIQRISIFGRREKPQLEPVDLSKILDEVAELQERELKLARIVLRRNYRQPSLVLADYSQMEQVFFNLIRNARQAVEPKGGGMIILSARDKGKNVEVRVSDNGIGITAEELPYLFRPFFTTKVRKDGDQVPSLGLGLWISRQIVRAHGGKIALESHLGKGTCFIVTLPRADQERLSPGTGPPAEMVPALSSSGGRILVADDETELAEVYRRYLAGKGASVSQATTAEEAFHLCRTKKFDSILVDYVMPGISGEALVRKIKRLAPRSRVVVITGKPIPKEDRKNLNAVVAGWLTKPVELEKLREMLAPKLMFKVPSARPGRGS